MKKNYKLVQCTLKNEDNIIVSWIPEKYAKLGKFVKLYHNGKWHDGWEVTKIGNVKLPTNEIMNGTKVDDKTKRYDNNI